jgi:hypothetical protein
MGEVERFRRFYMPRVLIEVSDIETPPFDGALLCVTGAQLLLLRNLCEYLHRETTFVSQYTDAGYYVPTSEEWDAIQAIVAELENELMGCAEIEQALLSIAAGVQCLCSQATEPTIVQPGPTYDDVVDAYLEDGTLVIEDDNGNRTPLESARCALAQLTWAYMWEFVTEIVMPFQEAALDVLLPAAMIAIASWAGGPVVGIPVSSIVGVLWLLGEIAAAGSLEDFRNALIANKQDIVCAIYTGLLVDYRTASNAAWAVIDGMTEASPIDKQILKLSTQPWVIGKMQTALTNNTEWSQDNRESGYCDLCEAQSLPFQYVIEFPPCHPPDWTEDWQCTFENYAALNGTHSGYSNAWWVDSTSRWEITIEIEWTSRFPGGWTVGALRLQKDDGEGGWETIQNALLGITNSQPPGTPNYQALNIQNYEHDGSLIRLQVNGQPPQGDVNPWPLQITQMMVTITEWT